MPLVWSFASLVQARSQAQRDRGAIGTAFVAVVILAFDALYLMGLGVAILGGWSGGAQKATLGRPRTGR